MMEFIKNPGEVIANGLKDGLLKLLKMIGVGIITHSYWICLFMCIGALLLYMAGLKKAGKYVGVSFIVYFILQGLGTLL